MNRGFPLHVTRRDFIAGAGAALAGGRVVGATGTERRIKAVAFDAFPIFDPRPVFQLAEALFPGMGADLSNEWRVRQFEYCWMRVLSGRYADFWQVTGDSLNYAARKVKVDLAAEKRERLLNAYLTLKAWPDAKGALAALRSKGYRLAFLSNFTAKMLDANIRSAGLEGMFEAVVSTDEGRTYKPDAKAYQLGLDRLKLKREEVLFAAFAGWDAAGAKAFGYPTFWVNRSGQPAEELGERVDGEAKDLEGVLKYLE